MQNTYRVKINGITICGYAIPQTLSRCLAAIRKDMENEAATVKQAVETGYQITQA